MPCKHEGGTESCIRNSSGACKIRTWVLAQKPDRKVAVKQYVKENYKSSSINLGRTGDSGYAGELIVRTDLLLRGLEVTVPENRNSPDDVHFLSSTGWVSVQVKVSRVNKNTGVWSFNTRRRYISSDVLAWVDLRDKEIRYLPNIKPVPPELLT